jgi:hypothetical protein
MKRAIETRLARIEVRQADKRMGKVGQVIANEGETTEQAHQRYLAEHPGEKFSLVIVRQIITPPLRADRP